MMKWKVTVGMNDCKEVVLKCQTKDHAFEFLAEFELPSLTNEQYDRLLKKKRVEWETACGDRVWVKIKKRH